MDKHLKQVTCLSNSHSNNKQMCHRTYRDLRARQIWMQVVKEAGAPVQGCQQGNVPRMQGQGPAWFGAQWIPQQQTFMQQNSQARVPSYVKNANPSTPLVYPNQRFRKITTPDANTYYGCDSAVTYFSAMSNKGTCSTPTPKCTSDSFFSLQTPHTTEQVNKNQGRHTATAHKQRKEASCSSVATVSSALGDTAVQFSSEHSTPLP